MSKRKLVHNRRDLIDVNAELLAGIREREAEAARRRGGAEEPEGEERAEVREGAESR